MQLFLSPLNIVSLSALYPEAREKVGRLKKRKG
jgi:hypothetical protein